MYPPQGRAAFHIRHLFKPSLSKEASCLPTAMTTGADDQYLTITWYFFQSLLQLAEWNIPGLLRMAALILPLFPYINQEQAHTLGFPMITHTQVADTKVKDSTEGCYQHALRNVITLLAVSTPPLHSMPP